MDAKQKQDEREKAILEEALKGFSNGSPVASSRKEEEKSPISPRRHNRNVSWDLQENAPQAPEASNYIPVQATNPGKNSSHVSLRDVIKSSPYEDEAEAYIQRALEETDPTVAGETEVQTTLLGNVPDDARHRFEDEQQSRPTTEETMPSAEGEERSTGDALWAMAAQMRKSQRNSLGSSSHELSVVVEEEMSPGDVFAHNAAALLRRSRTKAQEPSQEEIPTSSTVGSDPKAKWKKLQQAVQVAGALKKDDDAPVPDDVDMETGKGSGSDEVGGKPSQGMNKHGRSGMGKEEFKSEFRDFQEWLKFARPSMYQYIKRIVLFLIIPCTGVAALLFYAVGNPPCGTQEECIDEQKIPRARTPTQAPSMAPSVLLNTTKAPTPAPGVDDAIKKGIKFFIPDSSDQASVSWWLIFVGVRQVLTLALAKGTQALLVDFLALRTRWFVKWFGGFVTLLIVQSKGWPFLLLFWALYDFAVLYGDTRFAKHWLFWQDAIDLFNESNPSGGITSGSKYLTVLGLAVGVSAVVAVKRFWIGLSLGRQTFSRYAEDLKTAMEKAILVGEIAKLARDMEDFNFRMDDFDQEHVDAYQKTIDKCNNSLRASGSSCLSKGGLVEDMEKDTFLGSDLDGSVRIKINELLGEWEEPEMVHSKNEAVPISSIIQFRQSISCLNTAFPFTGAFGPADSREACVASAETVYGRLLLSNRPSTVLKFDALALVAIRPDGSLDEEKLKKLVKLFRPDREGNLTLLDFAKSVDSVYKDLRLLRASVANSSRMDKAFEKIFNIFFYFIIICIVLAVIGIDPWALFASISGFVVGFAFMIGPAASKYFEGLLLILVRRPYDIGDRINVSNVNIDTSPNGSSGWIVKDVGLYHTTVVYGVSCEVATYSNGSLANSRIINHARSPQASLWFTMKFPIDTPYQKFKVFKGAIEKFIKARPREWISFSGFRSTTVEVDRGFVEYIILGVHRESWQSIGALKQSLADLTSFALELSKKMDMRYESPPLPVDLTMKQGFNGIPDLPPVVHGVQQQGSVGSAEVASHRGSVDIGPIAAMFGEE